MNPTTGALIEQLSDSKSAKRRSAAKKIRKSKDPHAGEALFVALQKELQDLRTWETQYQMIMALGHCLYTDATEFLEGLSREGRVEMVQIAIGDSLFRLAGGAENNLSKVLEFIDRGDAELIHGAFQAMASERVIPADEIEARKIVEYGCSLKLNENDWAVIWLLRAVPGWPASMVEPLLKHWSAVESDAQQQIHGAVGLARNQKYCKWSPL
ncbi:MAG: HEAT repeat domain-containing protein [Roseibacillus sp.]